MAIAWLEIENDAGALTNVNGGAGLALPRNARGWAAALDLYDNGGSVNDPSVPYWGVFKLDPTRGMPGTYDWHVVSTASVSGVVDVWHRVVVTVAGGSASLSVDGATVLTTTGVTGSRGTIGFACSVGGVTGAGFYLDDVEVEYPNPAPGCRDR